jgi:hypothetical protein
MKPVIHLVIATHGEDLAWLDDIGLPAFVYDATGTRPGLIAVPNAAREAGQWLHHIVTHYHRLADWTLFLQGDPFAHCPDLREQLHARDFLRRHVTPLGRTQRYLAGHRHAHSIAADRLARDILGHVPDGAPWILGGQFAASAPALNARPLAWWQRVQQRVLAGSNSSAWAMERLWLHLLGGR